MSDLGSDLSKDFRGLTDGVGDVKAVVRAQKRSLCGEIGDGAYAMLGDEAGGLCEGESASKP